MICRDWIFNISQVFNKYWDFLVYTFIPKSPAIWACLGVNRLDMPRPTYQAKENALNNPHMPYHPDPHINICKTFISSIDYNVFIVL